MSSRLIFGFGYVGARVGQHWLSAGDEVHAVTRSPERAADLQAQGFVPHVANVVDPGTLQNLPEVDTVLYAVGFDRSANVPMHEVYANGLRNVLAALPQSVGRLIYISSTGVYGDQDGDWVDESTSCHPDREGGKASLSAEEILRNHPLGQKSVVLRLAGIYGPGRVPRREMLRSGEPVPIDPETYLNLVHVEDVVEVVNMAATEAQVPNLYLVSDGHPVRRGDYYRTAARLLAAPEPKFAPPESSGEQQPRRAATSKRISNQKLVRDLEIRWKYPSYEAGLTAILGQKS